MPGRLHGAVLRPASIRALPAASLIHWRCTSDHALGELGRQRLGPNDDIVRADVCMRISIRYLVSNCKEVFEVYVTQGETVALMVYHDSPF
jgi:hypothetical protein